MDASREILTSCNYRGSYDIDSFVKRICTCKDPTTHLNGSYLVQIDEAVYFAIIIKDQEAVILNCAQKRLHIPTELYALNIYYTMVTIQGNFLHDLSLCFGACMYFIKQYFYLCDKHDLFDIVSIIFPNTTYDNHRLNIIDFLKVHHPLTYGHIK